TLSASQSIGAIGDPLTLNVNTLVSANAALGASFDLRNDATSSLAANHAVTVSSVTVTGGAITITGSAGSGPRTFVDMSTGASSLGISISTAAGSDVLAGAITTANTLG